MPHIPFFQGKKEKKQREILETAAKRISAYAWSPLWSLSNKRISFNLVTTGAFHRTRFAEMFSQEKPACNAPPSRCPRWVVRRLEVHVHLLDAVNIALITMSAVVYFLMIRQLGKGWKWDYATFCDEPCASPGFSRRPSIASRLVTVRLGTCAAVLSKSPWELARRKLFLVTRTPQVGGASEEGKIKTVQVVLSVFSRRGRKKKNRLFVCGCAPSAAAECA